MTDDPRPDAAKIGKPVLRPTPPGRLVMVPLRKIKRHPANPRFIRDQDFDDLVETMRAEPDHLDARPLTLRQDGVCIAGNMRFEAAKVIGRDPVPCRVVEFAADAAGWARERAWMLRDNNDAGQWVDEAVAEWLHDLNEADEFDMRLTGFAEDEWARILDDVAGGGVPGVPAGADHVPETWGVLVVCDDEEHQAALLARFTEEGLECRSIVT